MLISSTLLVTLTGRLPAYDLAVSIHFLTSELNYRNPDLLTFKDLKVTFSTLNKHALEMPV